MTNKVLFRLFCFSRAVLVPFALGGGLAVILLPVLSLINLRWLLLIILAYLAIGVLLVFIQWIIVDKLYLECSVCDRRTSVKKQSYCVDCGGRVSIRSWAVKKVCDNGHVVRQHSGLNSYDYCPKCGEDLYRHG